MGVPALFRWLSKKYPKIVEPVLEDVPVQNAVEGGFEEIPIDMSQKNPNGMEFDNLYLDMNGIVHPCTHPEGKKPPETEEEMMIEVFKYTERVVNMVRPRKLLMIAIDGVAPRAKMNQQRSRRFRAAQEAKVKQEEKQALIDEYVVLGKPLSEELSSNKKAWDSNAITPGTPFMTLLTESLRYWIVYKMNNDKGWSQIQVILSDASVPGEGEHKIMDFVRRQRIQPEYDPNTKHVIYGLDADLIMLSLACHEPHFKVLREDVFLDQNKRKCFTCGQSGHLSNQCQGKPKEKADEHDIKEKPVERKPFIFLDVGTLREYLAVELNLGGLPFPFDLERAIDDWVLLIFFVGNDFLPHLPSLEIREGAIDTLLKIWKNNLASMGGYLTNCGSLDLKRTEIILEGLAAREDEIFRRRREAETRQDQNAKRRRIDNDNPTHVQVTSSSGVQPQRDSNQYSTHNLPAKPTTSSHNADPNASSTIPGLGDTTSVSMMSNSDVVKNRFAIRTANMDAAAMLKAELRGTLELHTSTEPSNSNGNISNETSDPQAESSGSPKTNTKELLPEPTSNGTDAAISAPTGNDEEKVDGKESVQNEVTNSLNDPSSILTSETASPQKRKADEIDPEDIAPLAEDSVVLSEEDEEDAPAEVSVLIPGQPSRPAPLTMLGNNMVEQEDTVKLWEPGYRERYYRQKFGIELSDQVERRKIIQHYVEGLAWVLAYYYRGCQSWQWFYPYHYSPFAADFTNLEEIEIKFTLGQPFKPYEQLMGVFPAASLTHIPDVYHSLMLEDESPIKDFYPEEFEIDMNGKKMLWQGIALLPFIEQDRLLSSMSQLENQLSEKDKSRNEPGEMVMFCGHAHPQYENFCKIYQRRDTKEPVKLDPACAKGVFGSALPDPNCIPGSTFHSPLPTVGLSDISNDKSIFVRFYVPPQLVPHRSLLLQGVKLERKNLSQYDRDQTRRSDHQHSYKSGGYSNGDGFHQQRRDFGDGPGIMSHYQSNSNAGGGAGYWNGSQRPSHHQQQQQPYGHSNNYRWPPVEASNRGGYSDGSAHRHSNYGAHHPTNSGGYSTGQRPCVPPTAYGSSYGRGGYAAAAPPTYYNNSSMNQGGHQGRYGANGMGAPLSHPLPAAPPHPSPYQYTNNNTHLRGRGAGPYRPPAISPAVSRPYSFTSNPATLPSLHHNHLPPKSNHPHNPPSNSGR